ncbi:MAG: hypothetical protein AAF916_12140 [Planctomycetota bacterium]
MTDTEIILYWTVRIGGAIVLVVAVPLLLNWIKRYREEEDDFGKAEILHVIERERRRNPEIDEQTRDSQSQPERG